MQKLTTQMNIPLRNCSCKRNKSLGINSKDTNNTPQRKGTKNNGLNIFLSNKYPKKENNKNTIPNNIVSIAFYLF